MTETPDIADVHGPATSEALSAAWNAWGRLDDHVIGHLVNPSFMGGPRWPALRQAHVVSRRDDALLVASDGLADPIEWSDADPGNGFEVEVYAIAEEIPSDADTMTVASSWLGRVVMATSEIVANNGLQVRRMLDHYGTITVSLPGIRLPEHDARFAAYADDPVVLLGLEHDEVPSSVDGPLSNIRLVNVKPLTTAEANFCVNGEHGLEEARAELARRLLRQPSPLRSILTRPSVV